MLLDASNSELGSLKQAYLEAQTNHEQLLDKYQALAATLNEEQAKSHRMISQQSFDELKFEF